MPSKIKILIFIITCIFISSPTSSSSQNFPYIINDFKFYPIPNVPRPQKGIPYIDSVFGTEVVRITDIADCYSPNTTRLYSGYPKHDIENANKGYRRAPQRRPRTVVCVYLRRKTRIPVLRKPSSTRPMARPWRSA